MSLTSSVVNTLKKPKKTHPKTFTETGNKFDFHKLDSFFIITTPLMSFWEKLFHYLLQDGVGGWGHGTRHVVACPNQCQKIKTKASGYRLTKNCPTRPSSFTPQLFLLHRGTQGHTPDKEAVMSIILPTCILTSQLPSTCTNDVHLTSRMKGGSGTLKHRALSGRWGGTIVWTGCQK